MTFGQKTQNFCQILPLKPKDLLKERDAITEKRVKDRSSAEKSQHKRLMEEIKKMKDRFPHISLKKAPKTSAVELDGE